MGYNGHRNWNHWNVALWLYNDEGWYNAARHAVRFGTLDNAARRLLSELPDETPDGAPVTYTSVRAALAGWEG